MQVGVIGLGRMGANFDLAEIAEVWRRGSVVASWLLDLTAAALASDPTLERFTGRVSDSGEGRWPLDAAMRFEFGGHAEGGPRR